ncbi:hypothetical protein [Caballeronia telluris]|uniref:hypothetical protein n=1 Tax=Caballeronia telluris TaxID=326475 RepID=UPI000A9951A7|nr:hypothetical protein [Caballeronia telluris]
MSAKGSEHQIANVAAGTATTDAVNVDQLKSVASSVSALDSSAVKYDTNAYRLFLKSGETRMNRPLRVSSKSRKACGGYPDAL